MAALRPVVLQLISMNPDAGRFKPYDIVISPPPDAPITVVVNVPKSMFQGDHLTPEGVVFIADQFARATERFNSRRLEEGEE